MNETHPKPSERFKYLREWKKQVSAVFLGTEVDSGRRLIVKGGLLGPIALLTNQLPALAQNEKSHEVLSSDIPSVTFGSQEYSLDQESLFLTDRQIIKLFEKADINFRSEVSEEVAIMRFRQWGQLTEKSLWMMRDMGLSELLHLNDRKSGHFSAIKEYLEIIRLVKENSVSSLHSIYNDLSRGEQRKDFVNSLINSHLHTNPEDKLKFQLHQAAETGKYLEIVDETTEEGTPEDKRILPDSDRWWKRVFGRLLAPFGSSAVDKLIINDSHIATGVDSYYYNRSKNAYLTRSVDPQGLAHETKHYQIELSHYSSALAKGIVSVLDLATYNSLILWELHSLLRSSTTEFDDEEYLRDFFSLDDDGSAFSYSSYQGSFFEVIMMMRESLSGSLGAELTVDQQKGVTDIIYHFGHIGVGPHQKYTKDLDVTNDRFDFTSLNYVGDAGKDEDASGSYVDGELQQTRGDTARIRISSIISKYMNGAMLGRLTNPTDSFEVIPNILEIINEDLERYRSGESGIAPTRESDTAKYDLAEMLVRFDESDPNLDHSRLYHFALQAGMIIYALDEFVEENGQQPDSLSQHSEIENMFIHGHMGKMLINGCIYFSHLLEIGKEGVVDKSLNTILTILDNDIDTARSQLVSLIELLVVYANENNLWFYGYSYSNREQVSGLDKDSKLQTDFAREAQLLIGHISSMV
jgi:hypothetical protein